MTDRLAIRRLTIRGLAPGDHPAPGDLARRLAEAAKRGLCEALADAMGAQGGEVVLRIRRLEIDLTLGDAFEPQAFATALASAIARELRRIGEDGSSEGVVVYASRAIYLAALFQALAERRAADSWWLCGAEGLRLLSPAQAIRTAALGEPRVGLEALASLPEPKRMAVLRALTPIEAERMLAAFARGESVASLEECARVVAEAAPAAHGASPLAAFVAAFARKPALAGPALAVAARLWSEIATSPSATDRAKAASAPAPTRARSQPPAGAEAQARRILAAAARRAPPEATTLLRLTPFGGLLLLLPDLGAPEIAEAVATQPEAAAPIAHAALGLCAGRERFADFLADPLWREWFGLAPREPDPAAPLRGLGEEIWLALAPLAAPIEHRRDARFLSPSRVVVNRPASRALTGLAHAATRRFARRLPGFRDVSAPFLWANVLAVSAAAEKRGERWTARLGRAPLDVLVSLARAAEGTVETLAGARIDVSRAPP